jgi:hypothetical protein
VLGLTRARLARAGLSRAGLTVLAGCGKWREGGQEGPDGAGCRWQGAAWAGGTDQIVRFLGIIEPGVASTYLIRHLTGQFRRSEWILWPIVGASSGSLTGLCAAALPPLPGERGSPVGALLRRIVRKTDMDSRQLKAARAQGRA